jgi:opacity protein-like surface antigen
MNTHSGASLVRGCSLALLLILGSVGVAVAQPTFSVRGNVGASFFRSPDATSSVLNSGTNLGLETELRLYRGFGLTVGVSYDTFTLNEENAQIYARGGGDLSFLGGMLGLRYTFVNDSDAHPYVTLGGGMYRALVSDRKEITDEGELVDAADDISTRQEGIHIAAGARFRLDDTYAVFGEPRFTFFDVDRGLDNSLRYFTLRLGVDVQL